MVFNIRDKNGRHKINDYIKRISQPFFSKKVATYLLSLIIVLHLGSYSMGSHFLFGSFGSIKWILNL